MARQFSRAYTHDHTIKEDGRVEFACSTDLEAWPWLALGPCHPVVVQAQNFWCSVGATMKLGGMKEGQWSALTWTDWTCGDPDAGIAVRGIYSREEAGKDRRFAITLFDAEDREIVTMRGRGVVFHTRNFSEWRSEAKSEAQRRARQDGFEFAPRDVLGIGPSEHPLVGRGMAGNPRSIPVLVTPENGLPPANPVLSGSGDHVNSVHMIEAARQAAAILRGDPGFTVSGGEMHLEHYVELGTPFSLEAEHVADNEVRFRLDQLERPCARIALQIEGDQAAG